MSKINPNFSTTFLATPALQRLLVLHLAGVSVQDLILPVLVLVVPLVLVVCVLPGVDERGVPLPLAHRPPLGPASIREELLVIPSIILFTTLLDRGRSPFGPKRENKIKCEFVVLRV